MWIVLKRRDLVLCGALFCCALGIAASIWTPQELWVPTSGQPAPTMEATVLLDAGHGGVDGGAIAADGTVESHINLAVAQRVHQMMLLFGQPATLMRDSDVSLHDEGSDTIRAKKVSDLANRVARINAMDTGVLVSIHQNSLPSSVQTHGAQVFYNQVGDAQPLAQTVQEGLNVYINTHKAKEAKAVSSSVYLLNHSQRPGIIVECGFLSNPQEAALLNTPEHQQKLALLIAVGVQKALHTTPQS